MRSLWSIPVLAILLVLLLSVGCQSSPAPAQPTSAKQPAAAPTQATQPAPTKAAAGAPTAALAKADSKAYPTKQIEVVVHSGPGSSVDLTARTVAEYLTKNKIVSQPMVVNNRQGGGGAIALNYFVGKKGDEHTMLSVSSANLLSNLARGESDAKFDDFAMIGILAVDSNVVAVPANSPFKNMKELVDAAKKQPKAVSQSIGAIGGSGHIIGAMLARATGVEFNYISFKSGAEAVTAVVSGNVGFTIENVSEMSELARGGKLRLLGVASEKRLALLPDLPTLKEQGIDVDHELGRGFALPAGASDSVLKFWDSAMRKVYDSPEWDKFAKDGAMEKSYMNSAESRQWMAKRFDQLRPVLEYLGLAKKK